MMNGNLMVRGKLIVSFDHFNDANEGNRKEIARALRSLAWEIEHEGIGIDSFLIRDSMSKKIGIVEVK